jgi:hypothetical protein
VNNLPEKTSEKDVLVQRYIEKPLLLNGLKFDLTIYVVVIGVDPI